MQGQVKKCFYASPIPISGVQLSEVWAIPFYFQGERAPWEVLLQAPEGAGASRVPEVSVEQGYGWL